jgi:molybdate transport system substrate-binding protein
MKKMLAAFLILLLITGIVSGCKGKSGQKPVEITVSAAASLKNALDEIKLIYEGNNPGIILILNISSSGTLQHQIEQGAPVDLFISAGQSQMDSLEEKQLIDNATRVNLVGNDLVLVVGKGNSSVKSFADLKKPGVKYIGIGEPKSVPAGIYAKEVLTSLKLWDTLKAKCVEAKDVRQVLAYVETGDAEAGLVYKSDTVVSDKVRIAAVAPADAHKPILYPAAVIKSSKNGEAAQEFLRFMNNPEGRRIFVKYGFKEVQN